MTSLRFASRVSEVLAGDRPSAFINFSSVTMNDCLQAWCAIVGQENPVLFSFSGCSFVYDVKKAIARASQLKIPLVSAELWRVSQRGRTNVVNFDLSSCQRSRIRVNGRLTLLTFSLKSRQTMRTFKILRLFYMPINVLQ